MAKLGDMLEKGVGGIVEASFINKYVVIRREVVDFGDSGVAFIDDGVGDVEFEHVSKEFSSGFTIINVL